jgi:MoaA/NifB/PqqE/SkfB family radical SAM enzyme
MKPTVDSFCYHPWTGLDINNNGKVKPCCKFRPEIENWQEKNIQDGLENYLTSSDLQSLRQKFINGEKPSGCVRCWNDEAAGYPSKRQLDFNRWQKELNCYSIDSNEFLFITLPLGNLCNLKCRICGPESSSSWIKEHRDIFNEKIKVQDWHKDPSIWNNIVNLSKNSLEIHIHGGEPFLYDNTEHLDILQSLINSGNSKNIRIHYSTNATVFPIDKYWKLWKNFGWIDIQASIDDFGRRFEYNRHPANWEQTKLNLLTYKKYVDSADNLQLSISTTVSVFTVYYLEEFFDWLCENQLPIPWLGKLHSPYYYRAEILPNYIKDKTIKKLQNSKYHDIQKISTWLETDESKHWNKFLEITSKHDIYRKENIQEIFPELFENQSNLL